MVNPQTQREAARTRWVFEGQEGTTGGFEQWLPIGRETADSTSRYVAFTQGGLGVLVQKISVAHIKADRSALKELQIEITQILIKLGENLVTFVSTTCKCFCAQLLPKILIRQYGGSLNDGLWGILSLATFEVDDETQRES
jgi:hypothetical protein